MNYCYCWLAALFFLALPAGAADWPQWRGPDRTDVSKETGLLKAWPKEGPKLLWTYENGGMGFAGPAIVGDRLYSMGTRNNKEVLFALDARTGKELWVLELGTIFVNGWGDGPRGTPTVDGGALYALGGSGDLMAVDAATGKQLWHVHFVKDLGGDVPDWGYTESPLVDGDRVIVTPGGARGTVAALDKKTGKEIWRCKGLTDGAAYSSPITAEVGGIKQYVQVTANGVAGIAADTGKLLWKSDIASNDTAVCPTPIFHDHHVYVTSGYGAGCGLVKLTPEGGKIKAETVYTNKAMVNQHGGALLLDGHIYGYSDGKGWVCQDFKTGKSVWEEKRKLGKGALTCAEVVSISTARATAPACSSRPRRPAGRSPAASRSRAKPSSTARPARSGRTRSSPTAGCTSATRTCSSASTSR